MFHDCGRLRPDYWLPHNLGRHLLDAVGADVDPLLAVAGSLHHLELVDDAAATGDPAQPAAYGQFLLIRGHAAGNRDATCRVGIGFEHVAMLGEGAGYGLGRLAR